MPKIDINKKRGCNSIFPIKDLWDKFEDGSVDGKYCIPIGKNSEGENITVNLREKLNILVAGGMYSGVGMFKRIALATLLKYNSPEDMKFILIDPVKISFFYFNNIEKSLLFPIIKENSNAVEILKWLQAETNRRIDILAKDNQPNIYSYNEKNTRSKIPSIVVFISELGELMDYDKNVEYLLISILQMTKAVGIHLIITTQRPTKNIITPLISTNIFTKIAFQSGSEECSIAILGRIGAEKLLGQGDLIMDSFEKTSDKIQGYCMEEDEIAKIIF